MVSDAPPLPPPSGQSPPGPVHPRELLGGVRLSSAGSGQGSLSAGPGGSAEPSRTLLSPHLFVSQSELDRPQ